MPGAPAYVPLIFALKDLRIRYYPDELATPDQFNASTCLMRGEQVLPSVDSATVTAELAKGPREAPAADPMGLLMRAQFTRWPESVVIAALGVFAFGPGDVKQATTCAWYSLQLAPNCTLARQLLQLLSLKEDPRIKARSPEEELREVLSSMSGEKKARPAPAARPAPRPSTVPLSPAFPACNQCNSLARPATEAEAAVFGPISSLPGMMTWHCPNCGGGFVRPLQAHQVDAIKRFVAAEAKRMRKPWWKFWG